MSRKNLGRKQLAQIGEEMVRCPRSCAGVNNTPGEGAIPRCLFLEEESAPGRGAIAIGLNPGTSSTREREYYVNRGITYQATVELWSDTAKFANRYYTATRDLIRAAGLSGPILWTELAKCENAPGVKGALPTQTYRTCVRHFLRRELENVPQDWVVFAIGREAYGAAAYLLTDRAVVGVPHPTGSRGQFPALFEGTQLRASVSEQIGRVVNGAEELAEWLTAKS